MPNLGVKIRRLKQGLGIPVSEKDLVLSNLNTRILDTPRGTVEIEQKIARNDLITEKFRKIPTTRSRV